ncbi:putative Gnk2-like domain-containing protein [Helianthus anomalus]
MRIMLLILLVLILPGSGHGKCSTSNTTFQKNQQILVNLLIKNAPLQHGFYNSSFGNNSDKVYGASQCKANISSNHCASCLNSSLGSYNGCPEFPEVEFVSSFCTTKIYNTNIIGVWTNYTTAEYPNQALDDPLVFSKGFSMMQDLASTVPYQPLMFQAAEMDVGIYGKRYGLAQCGRDLSTLDCKNCLEDRLFRYRSFVENRTRWEILGCSCSMWYSNVSDTDKNLNASVVEITPSALPSPFDNQVPPGSVRSGAERCHGGMWIGTNIWISALTKLLLATQVFHFS